jgi:hypothetical protein
MPNPTIENLTTLAHEGDGKTAGSRIGHGAIRFQFPDARSFTFDDWTNIDGGSANPSKADLQGAVATADRLVCEWASNDWDRSGSFFTYLATKLYFGADLPANWARPPADGGATIVLPLRDGVTVDAAADRWLFMLLVSGGAIAHWREMTGMRLNIGSANLHVVKRASAAKLARNLVVPDDFDVEAIVFDWPSLVKAMRSQVRVWIKQKYPAPGAYLGAALNLDTELADLLTKVAGFKKLCKSGYLVPEPHGNGYEIKATAKLFLGSTFDNDRTADLVTAFNHARFIMWMEWRIATELCLRRNGAIY